MQGGGYTTDIATSSINDSETIDISRYGLIMTQRRKRASNIGWCSLFDSLVPQVRWIRIC